MTESRHCKTYIISRPAPLVTPSDLKVETSRVWKTAVDGQKEDDNYRLVTEVKLILARRNPPEVRKWCYEWFKIVYDSIVQEMLSEQDPYSMACKDPYVQKLLEKLTVSGAGHQWRVQDR